MFRLRIFVLLACILLLAAPTFAQDTLINLGDMDGHGYFVDSEGRSLYMFTRDPIGSSVCVDRCLENWPALTVESADAVTAADGIPGVWGTTERPDDGSLQVTYNGMPLYYFAGDAAPGDTNGQGRGRVWWLMPPATVYAFRHGDAAPVLTGPNGMTLYIFTNDTDGTSVCYDQCATNWPPLTVDSMDAIVSGPNLAGAWGVTERTDGAMQVTYNNMPLYFFAGDAAIGDTNGQGRGDVWFTVTPEAVAVRSSDALGDYLVAANGMTVYLFTNDEAGSGTSVCVETCLENWPAVIVNPDDGLVGGTGVAGELGTITRADDSIQLTYNGMPLYYFAQDTAPGDTNGQGRGDVWFVVEP